VADSNSSKNVEVGRLVKSIKVSIYKSILAMLDKYIFDIIL